MSDPKWKRRRGVFEKFIRWWPGAFCWVFGCEWDERLEVGDRDPTAVYRCPCRGRNQ